jgi:hypothetical protein
MVKRPVERWLSHDDVIFCWEVARIRNDSKKSRHGGNIAHTSKGVNFFGAIAEKAAADLLGGTVNTDSNPYGGDSHEPDFIDRWGRKIEVKGTMFHGPNVMMKLEHDELFDDIHYCHCHVTVPDKVVVYPTIAGWLFRKHMVHHDFGYGDRFAIRADKILEIVNSEEGIKESDRWRTSSRPASTKMVERSLC